MTQQLVYYYYKTCVHSIAYKCTDTGAPSMTLYVPKTLLPNADYPPRVVRATLEFDV